MTPTEEARAILNHLKQSKGITQKEVAERLGYNHTYLSQALSDKMVSSKMLAAIREAYKEDIIPTKEEIGDASIKQLRAIVATLQMEIARLVEVVEGADQRETLMRLNTRTIENLTKLS